MSFINTLDKIILTLYISLRICNLEKWKVVTYESKSKQFMKITKPYFKLTGLLTFIFFLNACTVHKLREVPQERIADTETENIVIIHFNGEIFRLDKVVLSEGSLAGSRQPFMRDRSDNKAIFKELHLHISEEFELEKQSGGKVVIPLSSITKAEVYEIDKVKATGNLIAVFSGILGGALVLYGIMVLIFVTFQPSAG